MQFAPDVIQFARTNPLVLAGSFYVYRVVQLHLVTVTFLLEVWGVQHVVLAAWARRNGLNCLQSILRRTGQVVTDHVRIVRVENILRSKLICHFTVALPDQRFV